MTIYTGASLDAYDLESATAAWFGTSEASEEFLKVMNQISPIIVFDSIRQNNSLSKAIESYYKKHKETIDNSTKNLFKELETYYDNLIPKRVEEFYATAQVIRYLAATKNASLANQLILNKFSAFKNAMKNKKEYHGFLKFTRENNSHIDVEEISGGLKLKIKKDMFHEAIKHSKGFPITLGEVFPEKKLQKVALYYFFNFMVPALEDGDIDFIIKNETEVYSWILVLYGTIAEQIYGRKFVELIINETSQIGEVTKNTDLNPKGMITFLGYSAKWKHNSTIYDYLADLENYIDKQIQRLEQKQEKNRKDIFNFFEKNISFQRNVLTNNRPILTGTSTLDDPDLFFESISYENKEEYEKFEKYQVDCAILKNILFDFSGMNFEYRELLHTPLSKGVALVAYNRSLTGQKDLSNTDLFFVFLHQIIEVQMVEILTNSKHSAYPYKEIVKERIVTIEKEDKEDIKEIEKLKAIIENKNKQINSLSKQLTKIDSDEDKIKEQAEEIKRLKEELANVEPIFVEVNQQKALSPDEAKAFFNSKDVCFVSGHQNTIAKLKLECPEANFLAPRDYTVPFPENTKYLIFFASYSNHAQFHRAKAFASNNDVKILFVNEQTSNPTKLLLELSKQL